MMSCQRDLLLCIFVAILCFGHVETYAKTDFKLGPLSIEKRFQQWHHLLGAGLCSRNSRVMPSTITDCLYFDPSRQIVLRLSIEDRFSLSYISDFPLMEDDKKLLDKGDLPLSATIHDLMEWQTSNGIKLRSSYRQVLAAYGPPPYFLPGAGSKDSVNLIYPGSNKTTLFVIRRHIVTKIALMQGRMPWI